ncbi:hypothetical protein QN416_11860 [Glaciimonas sp. Cout2]|uniref:hypothetical protein n=2 Tax=unclassified Glaciimonas TaxID=2644401 RepID=UPI002B226728|nr:hypothetical protein [Glaciimonas sp. Cout2]MEB0012317.1 hypothetical protein [Glaciimonas sp. Cout2]
MQFFGLGTASINLQEGSNQLTVKGSVGACSASDQMRLFYIKPDDVCYSPVEDLQKVNVPDDSAIKGFYTGQICIAKYSCGSRLQMENTDWLTKVVPAFVQPLLDKSGEWKKVMEACENQSWLLPTYVANKNCESDMAKYHVAQDIQSALNINGCGTDDDWRKVGKIINECVAETNSIVPAFFAQWIVTNNRNDVRRVCQSNRENL